MTRAIPKSCDCCNQIFFAQHNAARYCSLNCKQTAYYRRRKVRDNHQLAAIAPQAVQPEILDDPDELPAAWRDAAQEPAAAALEVREWQGTPIQRRPADGYVNATAMCKANGKRWGKFRESAQCEAYIQALAAEDRISVFALVDSQRGGAGAGGSTWIHPDLATELARWISPAFSVFVNRWFRSVVESGQLAPLPPSPHPTLPSGPLAHSPGILVLARSKREAFQLWHDAVQDTVRSALTQQLSTKHRTDSGVRAMDLPVGWHPVY
jgi:hypothetical protein